LLSPDTTGGAVAIGCIGAIAGWWFARSGRLARLFPRAEAPQLSRRRTFIIPPPGSSRAGLSFAGCVVVVLLSLALAASLAPRT
jgi:hypothetical protein